MGSELSESVNITWKDAFPAVASRLWPNIAAICRELRVSRSLIHTTIERDADFKRVVEEVGKEFTDRVHAVRANMALEPKGVIDRAEYLRAHMPELYDRAKKIVVEGHRVPIGEANRRSNLAEQVTDAEIVNAYWTRKERQALKQGRLEIEAETKPKPSSPQNPNP